MGGRAIVKLGGRGQQSAYMFSLCLRLVFRVGKLWWCLFTAPIRQGYAPPFDGLGLPNYAAYCGLCRVWNVALMLFAGHRSAAGLCLLQTCLLLVGGVSCPFARLLTIEKPCAAAATDDCFVMICL